MCIRDRFGDLCSFKHGQDDWRIEAPETKAGDVDAQPKKSPVDKQSSISGIIMDPQESRRCSYGSCC